MSKSETPITDAVAQAQAEGGLVEWQITVSSHSKTGYSAKLQAQGECFMVTEFKYLSESDNLSWQRGSHADAAAALRLAAEKLSPDPTRRALEIAARLLCWDKCPNIIELPSPWWDGCKLPRPTGPDALDGVFKPCGSDQQEECWHTYLLEQAAKQLAAETEAAKSEGDDENEE